MVDSTEEPGKYLHWSHPGLLTGNMQLLSNWNLSGMLCKIGNRSVDGSGKVFNLELIKRKIKDLKNVLRNLNF